MRHDSVLLKEAIDFLCNNPDGRYIDCTGGLGGHSAELLSRLSSKARLWICDYHKDAVERLSKRFEQDERVTVLHSRYSRVFDNLNFSFDGILADLGISSPQLEDETLGIGFGLDEVFLDMRLDSSLETTAADILKDTEEAALADIFYIYGGERASRKLARAIVEDRKKGVFYSHTHELRELCSRVLGRYYYKKKIHPATKIFQALRIVVNRELEEVEALLEKAPAKLNPAGRFVVMSFHSGEDRLVKSRFRELALLPGFCLPVRKAVKPGRDEVLENVRARSARMRVLEKAREEDA